MNGRRRGYVIVEMLLVMGALTAIFGVCVALLSCLMKLDRGGRAHLAEATASGRLSRQFRLDVRAAAGSNPARDAGPPSGHLELTFPGGRVVEYEGHEGRLARLEREGDRVLRRETYAFPSRGTPRFLLGDEEGKTFATLVLPGKAEPRPGPPRPELRIEARLGKDHLLAGKKKEAPR